MIKIIKKELFIAAILLIYVFSMNDIIWANTDEKQTDNQNFTQSISHKYNLTEEEQKGLETFTQDQQEEVEQMLRTNRQAVEITYNLSELDEVGEIRKLSEATIEELQNSGMSLEEAQNVKQEIKEIESKTIEVISEEYKCSTTDAKMLQNAVKVNNSKNIDGFKDIDYKNKCSASGSISAKKMATSMVKYDNSKKVKGKRKNADYEILVHYQWKSDPMFVASSDRIACAWGGGLNITTKKVESTYRYYNPSKSRYIFVNKTPSKDEKPNKGIIYTFPQKYSKGTIYSAYARFRLYQGTFKNYSTKAISNYAHRIIKVTGGSISITGTPGISIGSGFDKSKQVSQGLLR